MSAEATVLSSYPATDTGRRYRPCSGRDVDATNTRIFGHDAASAALLAFIRV